MPIIKNEIKFNGNSVNIKFTLDTITKEYGQQQSINKLIDITSSDLINPVNDSEFYRFNSDDNLKEISFYFSQDHLLSFESAGFTSIEIQDNDINLASSFFIVDIFDTYKVNVQKKIATSYVTKIINSSYNKTEPKYILDTNNRNQFFYVFLPQSFIGDLITIECYLKFSFYNAKTGKILPLYNYESTNPQLSLFFPININTLTKKWKFNSSSQNVVVWEIVDNPLYVNKVNNTLNSSTNEAQPYPIGTAFNSEDGTYII